MNERTERSDLEVALKPDPFEIQPIVTQKTKKAHKID